MLKILNELLKNPSIDEHIAICKSNSRMTGTKLRKAHEFLGETIATAFNSYFSETAVVVVLMRAGLPFAYGFANKLNCTLLFYDDKHDLNFFEDNMKLLSDKMVIFIDAVIDSGKGMLKTIEKSTLSKESVKIVTNVLCDKAIESFKDYEIFTVRVSDNSFKGGKVTKQANGIGPDTGDRLFLTI